MKNEVSDEGRWVLSTPFWIDTDGYSDRDREMFCAGVDYASLAKFLRKAKAGDVTVVLRENASRARMLAAHNKIVVTIEPLQETHASVQVVSRAAKKDKKAP